VSTEPPPARVEAVSETRFGVTTADPYRWMEDGDDEVRDWLAGQDRFTRAYLTGLPDRAALLARVRELTADVVRDPALTLVGDLAFELGQPQGGDVPVLAVREGGRERVLLDPASLPGREHSHLDWYAPSPDGRYVACGISQGGSERSTLRVVDTGTGDLLADALPGTFHGVVSWLPAGDALLYHQYLEPPAGTPAAQRRRDSQTCLHRLGRDREDDVVVLARGRNPRVPLAPIDRPFVLAPAGSDWVIAVVSHSALAGSVTEGLSDCTLYAAPRAGLSDPASCPWRRVAGPEDGVTSWAVHGGILYLVTYRGAPRSQVLAVRLGDPELTAGVVMAGSDRAVVAIRVVGDHLLVHELDAGLSRLRRVPLAGGPGQPVPLPADGAIRRWTGHPGRPEALITLNSWTVPSRIYRYDDSSGTVTDTGWLPAPAADFGDIEVRDLRVPVRDGTLVPMRVVGRRGLALDGENPTLLSGYGSYGLVASRLFDPPMLAWYERGGVYALAGLRGGGEYGREWHEAGRGPRKENTITDFIDCAQYLIDQGYTRPSRLAGEGTSAGGIPVGGALVRRPELWAAMVLQVAATNMTRQEFSENGPINIPEHGTVTTEAGWHDLLITDCYLRVADDTRYPAVLLTAGINDPRLPYWQPAKMAARLQAASASGRPVLLRVEAHGGHGFGSTRDQRDQLTADILAFLLHELAG
jgi:prolyl oligopeptidase